MSKEETNKAEETIVEEVVVKDEGVVQEDVVATDDDEILEEEIIVTIETSEKAPQKSFGKKVLKGILVGGLMILGIMVIFASGFYTGAHVVGGSGGHGGGRSGGKGDKVEPMVIETDEGYQDITTLPHVLTEEELELIMCD